MTVNMCTKLCHFLFKPGGQQHDALFMIHSIYGPIDFNHSKLRLPGTYALKLDPSCTFLSITLLLDHLSKI